MLDWRLRGVLPSLIRHVLKRVSFWKGYNQTASDGAHFIASAATNAVISARTLARNGPASAALARSLAAALAGTLVRRSLRISMVTGSAAPVGAGEISL